MNNPLQATWKRDAVLAVVVRSRSLMEEDDGDEFFTTFNFCHYLSSYLISALVIPSAKKNNNST